MHVTLVVGLNSGEFEVPVGGAKEWPRELWLQEDLRDIADRVANLLHQHDIPPVLRVGGSSQGYPSLEKGGVTDYPNFIPHFPWDAFLPELTAAYAASPEAISSFVHAEALPETHLYGPESDAEVEQAAIEGDDHALTEVIAVASEEGSRGARAKAVLAQVPVEELEEWNEAHK